MSTARWQSVKTGAGRVLLALLVVAAVGGVLWYRQVAPEVEPQAPSGPPPSGSKADMVVREFRHVETRMDRTLWILEAAEAEVFEQQARLRSVKVTWHGESGADPVVITSREGLVDFKRRIAELQGAVRVERADGSLLLTESLIFDEGKKLLRAPQALTISTPDFTLRGERLDVNLATRNARLRGPVLGELRRGLADLAGSS